MSFFSSTIRNPGFTDDECRDAEAAYRSVAVFERVSGPRRFFDRPMAGNSLIQAQDTYRFFRSAS